MEHVTHLRLTKSLTKKVVMTVFGPQLSFAREFRLPGQCIISQLEVAVIKKAVEKGQHLLGEQLASHGCEFFHASLQKLLRNDCDHCLWCQLIWVPGKGHSSNDCTLLNVPSRKNFCFKSIQQENSLVKRIQESSFSSQDQKFSTQSVEVLIRHWTFLLTWDFVGYPLS